MSSAREPGHVRNVSAVSPGAFNDGSPAKSRGFGLVRRGLLLMSVSAAALFAASPGTHARQLGAWTPAPSAAAVAAAQSASQEAQRAAQSAQNALKRATLAIQATQASQQAARDAARAALSGIPNGLRPGGLQVAPGANPGSDLWQGAKLPTETTEAGRTKVTVDQTQQKAILTWRTFNVGKETDLYFDQRAGGANRADWIALNRVVDPAAAPSEILGSIKADGQVYLINGNGIIFGGTSQINVGTLVASSLSLSNQQFLWGINDRRTVTGEIGTGSNGVPMPQFGYLGQGVPTGAATDQPGQIPGAAIGTPPGGVRVEAGAEIAAASGGKVMLFAPHVVNAGRISAPDGQVIMAAGEQVYLTPSSGVRGLEVAVSAPMRWLFAYYQLAGAKGAETIYDAFTLSLRDVILPDMEARAATVGYSVVNNGIVQADRGNITVMARDIVQNGALLASTALNNRDGSILLRAWDQGMACYSSSACSGNLTYWSTGTVTLAPGSVTAAMPDLSDTGEIELAALAARYKPGSIDVQGKFIDIQSQANVIVPAGTINLNASAFYLYGYPTVRDGSRIYIGEDAYLGVAGLKDVAVAMERNVIEAELRINELRDSPLYRDSWLRGLKIKVDRRESGLFTDGPMAGVNWIEGSPGAWVGTPLADVTGWIGVGKTDLGELSTVGGSITIRSSGALITRPGSLFDVSGGSVRYNDGWIDTTRLLGANGRIYDISDALPDTPFVGIAGGFTRSNAHWGITETWTNPLGKTGRRFEKGYTEGRNAGSLQFHAGEAVILEGGYWGGVVVGEREAATGKVARAGTLTFGGGSDEHRQWLIANLVISNDPILLPADFTATSPVPSFWYAGGPEIADSFRLRTTHLDADVLARSGMGRIDLYVSADVSLPQGTTLDLTPGSTFSVIANTVPTYTQGFQIDGVIRIPGGRVRFFDAETLTFGPRAALDLGGQWVNGFIDAVSALPPVINGGSAQLMNARFQPGAVIDVSGGGWYRMQGAKPSLSLGDAGEIVLTDPGQLLNADLRGYAAGSGGRLSVETDGSFQIGGATPSDPGTTRLSETLFAERGFRSVQINTSGTITVPSGVTVAQIPLSIDRTASRLSDRASGTPITAMEALAVLPLAERAKLKPASLSLTGDSVIIEEGAVIRSDVRGTIALATPSGATGVIDMRGTLEAPAGTISLISPGRTITIGDTGALLARGMPVIEDLGRAGRSGSVLGGGAVRLEAASLNFASVSLIDVSGAIGTIDLPRRSLLGGNRLKPMTLSSNGGSITLQGQGLVQGAWRGQGGDGRARGGKVTISSAAVLSETATTGAGLILRPSNIEGGAFDDLVFTSTVRLDGASLAVGGSITLSGGLANGGAGQSRLSAPYISLAGSPGSVAPASDLILAASLIDITRAGIRGFERTVLEASDIRLMAGVDPALLETDGTLILKAGQVYPVGTATLRASEKIIIAQNGTAGTALSAGGTLTLEAPVIEQGGTLKAPFGQIILKASNRLTLQEGSVTSVSGDGLILPFGTLSNNEHWMAGLGIITALPEKRITLDAPIVDVAAGSVVDVRGGGDLYAWEHVPGPGGSHDVLARPGMYAILPAFNDAVATDAAIRAGDRVWLDGGNGLAAGWYALLPAHYALLPGAYSVQAVGGSQGATVPTSVRLTDGSVIMTGYRGNAFDGSRDQQASSWRVMSGAVVRRYSEYNEAFANTYFASEAFKVTQYRQTGQDVVTPRLPVDGGSVVFKATQDLILNGQLRSQPGAGGRGGLVDIAAEKIAVLGAGQDASALRADGYLVIDATNLSGFGAGSLLLGGVRSGDAQGLRVDVTASDIVVRNDAGSALSGSEIILAASETIHVGAGSVIRAQGEAPTGAGDLVIAPQVRQVISDNGTPSNPNDDYVATPARDWGALIRISNGDAVRVRRTNVDTSIGGELAIGAGAVLNGGKALLIDATRNALVTQARLSAASLSLASGRIGFGGGSGLVIDAPALAALANTQHLTLRSYSSIDFHSSVDLSGLNAVTFDAAALVGYGSSAITIAGNRVVLENTASTLSEPVGAGHGSLGLVASELVLGEGAKALRGFDTVALSASARFVGEGNGSLDVGAAALVLSSPVMIGRGGAAQSVTTSGALLVAAAGNTPVRDERSLGARWSLTGRSILYGGRAVALGGAVELTATNGDVVIADGASIDVGGFGKAFFDVAEYTDAGRIALTARGGSVLVQPGAVLDLAAHPAGGGAGSLVISSDGNQVVLDGTIRAQAAAGQRGASFALDIASLSNFASLNQRLGEAGFSRSREFRIRTGDVTVDGTTVAESFLLAADQGHVTVAGIIDARARYGGSIAIYGGNGLTMTNAAVLRAGATDTVDNLGAGRITLGISGGSLVVQGGLIDVAGGEGGKVTLRAPVIAHGGADTVNVAFAGSIAGAREIVLEGYKRFNLADLASNPNFVGVTINGNGQAELDLAASGAGKLNVLADYGTGTLVEFVRDFDISAAYANLGGLAGNPNFHARPGMELNHPGDIVLKSNWNLGAGIVDEAGALAAGVMAIDPILNKAYVVASRKGELLANHTTMVYRTGGSIFGEPGALALRAGGDLILEGGITDGFFQFADKLDPTYLAKANSFAGDYKLLLNGGFDSGPPSDWSPLTNWSDYVNWYGTGSVPFNHLGLGFGLGESILLSDGVFIPASSLNVPYSAAANAPAARGQLPGGMGDALRHAELFPAVTKPSGDTVVPASWSYALVAGAAPVGQSANPMQRAANAAGSIVLRGLPSFAYAPEPPGRTRSIEVDLDPWFYLFNQPDQSAGGIPIGDWLNDILGRGYGGINPESTAVISTGSENNNPTRALFQSLLTEFVAEHGLVQDSPDPAVGYAAIHDWSGFNIVLPFSTYQLFYSEKILPNLSRIISAYSWPGSQTQSVQTMVTPYTAVRSGTGDINVAASRDIKLNTSGAIYTAGQRDRTVMDDFTSSAESAYGVQGGHVRIAAGGSIHVALPNDRTQMQHYTEWLKRQGAMDASYVYQPGKQSSWWIDFGNFQSGVGALGGGNVAVNAGGDLDNLTVALTTNGRVRGGRLAGERKLLELRNGGDMTVEAGGAVKAGYYYIGRGAGSITAGEFAVGREVAIRISGGGTTRYPIAPILSLGDATLAVRTAGDLRLQTVLDPLLVGLDGAFMNGQTDGTALNLTSTGGDVILVGQAAYLSKDLDVPSNGHPYQAVNAFAGNLYPSKTLITALNGSVINQGTFYTMPGSSPELRILAGNDVRPGAIVMSRATPAMIAAPFMPVPSGMHSLLMNDLSPPPSNLAGHDAYLYGIRNPEHLPNENDYEPSRIYALNGSILGAAVRQAGSDAAPVIVANEQAWFRAGKDIRSIDVGLRNIRPTDVSLIEAGNDIIGGTLQDPLQGQRRSGYVEVQGPGALVVSAGRDVYGTTLQLYSTGNRKYDANNRPIPFTEILGLSDQSAAITVMAGLKGKQPSYDAFAATYLDPASVAAMPDHLKTSVNGQLLPLYLTDAFETRKSGTIKKTRTGLVSFNEDMTGETLSPLEAWARFETLPQMARERFVRQVYMQELREAGIDQNEPGTGGLPRNGGYNRGYAAIEALFPGKDWKGDVAIGNALFRTMSGGDIEVLTPGGGLQVAALGTAVNPGYGLVTLGKGDINIFAQNDVVVNRSRILTFGGGDEIIWSTLGDIDAGRGAKTARVPSAPEIVTNLDGVTRVLEKADISGSGIGTIIGFTGVEEGDVHLIAPQGTVNAGDAGVRVSGNLTLAARFVLNAANFDVGGEVKGLPPAKSVTGSLKLEGGDTNQVASDAAKAATQSSASQQPSIIIVEVVGFGGGGADKPENGEEERDRSIQGPRTYNTNSPFQVVGAGSLNQAADRYLTEEEKRALRR